MSQSKTLVTVIVPAYNCASTVAETLDSVLAQDHLATEVVVVNDGSTDDTLEVLRRFGERIRVIDQPNAGPPAARNAGLRAARGEYIAFLDADDVWIQGKLSAQARHLDMHPEVGTVFTNWYVWQPAPDGTFTRRPEIEARHVDDSVDHARSGWLYTRLLFTSELLTTTVMMRGSVVRRIGEFDLRLWNGDDYDYWLRASREGQITRLASIGALYRILPNSVSRRPREINYEYEVVKGALDRWGRRGPDGNEADEGAVQRRLDELQIAHAYGHLLRGNADLAFRTYRRMLAKHPARPRLWWNTARAALKAGAQRRTEAST
jgi:glycosyltransferase involved in cell wall biosynthesis